MSGRQLTLFRRLIYTLLAPLGTLIIRLLWLSCKIEVAEGHSHLQSFIENKQPVIFCYWHRLQLFCVHYVLQVQKVGFPLGFLISPSVDGEVPAKIAKRWGAEVIRASTTRTGAKAIKAIYQLIGQGISPVTTPDGPSGPIYKFQPGAILLAQFTKVPIIPLSYAAERAWRLKTWDRFLIPKPFSRIKIVIGEPCYMQDKMSMEQIKQKQIEMEAIMKDLYAKANSAWESSNGSNTSQ